MPLSRGGPVDFEVGWSGASDSIHSSAPDLGRKVQNGSTFLFAGANRLQDTFGNAISTTLFVRPRHFQIIFFNYLYLPLFYAFVFVIDVPAIRRQIISLCFGIRGLRLQAALQYPYTEHSEF